MRQIVTGTITGTAAAINVPLGFIPDHVRLVNDTAGSALEWFSSMTNGHGYKRIAVGTGTKITAAGISSFAGADGISAGFTLGTDVDINTNTTPIRFIASRGFPA